MKRFTFHNNAVVDMRTGIVAMMSSDAENVAALLDRAVAAEDEIVRSRDNYYKSGLIDGLKQAVSVMWGASPKQECIDQITREIVRLSGTGNTGGRDEGAEN